MTAGNCFSSCCSLNPKRCDCDFSLELISRCLRSPPRQPAYREGRDHAAFVTNLPADSAALHRVIASEWRADDPLSDWPMEATHQLAEEKYARDEWNLRH